MAVVSKLRQRVQIVCMAPYEKLKAWQSCHQLALAIYAATDRWPREELFGLTAQAGEPPRRYLNISLGSLSELSYTLLLARDRSLLPSEQWAELTRLRESAGGLVWLLYRSLGS